MTDIHTLTTPTDVQDTPTPTISKHITLSDGTTIRSGELYAITIPAPNNSPDTPNARTIIGTLDHITTKHTNDGTFYLPVFSDAGYVPVNLAALKHSLTIKHHYRNKYNNSPHDTITIDHTTPRFSGP